MSRAQSMFGIFPNRESVEEAISALRADGFLDSDIAVVTAETATRDLAHVKRTKALEGIAVGATLGALILGTLGWLFATGAISPNQLPYMEWLNGIQPVQALLMGIGAGGFWGGIIGVIIGFSIPEYVAKRYKGRLRKKGILLSVHCENATRKMRARSILLNTGGEKVAANTESIGDYVIVQPNNSRREGMRAVPLKNFWPFVHQSGAEIHDEPFSSPVATARSNRSDGTARIEDRLNIHTSDIANRITARELMSTNIEVVEDTTTLAKAAEKMRTAGTSLLLVRSENMIVGEITDRNIAVRANAEGYNPTTTTVRSVMTNHYNYCREDQDLAEVARIMEEKHVSRLPVLDRAMRPVGVISLKDLATKAKNAQLEGQVLRLVATEKD